MWIAIPAKDSVPLPAGLNVLGGPAQNLALKVESLEASSEQGEEEMEVDSNEEDSEQKGAGGAFSQTMSALSSLKPGEHCLHHLETYRASCRSQHDYAVFSVTTHKVVSYMQLLLRVIVYKH